MQKLSEKIRMLLMILAAAELSIVSLAAQAPLPVPQPPPTAQGVPQPVPQPIPQPAPVMFPPAELERIVSPISLYPDPLLAQTLAAATFADQIPAAAQWADGQVSGRNRTCTAENMVSGQARSAAWAPRFGVDCRGV